MKPIIGVLTVLTLGIFNSAAIGSGFKCTGDEEAATLSVKLFNHVDPTLGTRVPAVMVISNEEGTLVTRKGGSIRKHNRANTVQYVIEGSRRLDADTAILQVAFKEGVETLEAGETADAQLILIKDEDRSVYSLSCERYLKQD